MGGSGGGGGGWNPFENVSMSKPFGDSALGQAGGAVQNTVGNMTQDVSMNKPFGNSTLSTLVGGNGGLSSVFNGVSMDKPFGTDSWLGQALYGNQNAPLDAQGKNKKTGEQGQPNPDAPPGAEGGLPSFPTAPVGGGYAPPTPIYRATRPGALSNAMANQAEEERRRAMGGAKYQNKELMFTGNVPTKSQFLNAVIGSLGPTATP